MYVQRRIVLVRVSPLLLIQKPRLEQSETGVPPNRASANDVAMRARLPSDPASPSRLSRLLDESNGLLNVSILNARPSLVVGLGANEGFQLDSDAKGNVSGTKISPLWGFVDRVSSTPIALDDLSDYADMWGQLKEAGSVNGGLAG